MLKLAKIFILTIFVFCNFSYAYIPNIEVGDEADAFDEVFMDAVTLSTEEANALKGYHKNIKDHHNQYVGPGDYTAIHLARRPNGNVQSAIKFTHPEGGDFIYKLIIRTDKKSGDVKLHRRPKVFGSYKETIAFREKWHQDHFVTRNQKALKDVYDNIMSSTTLKNDNFKSLSDRDLKKEIKKTFLKLHDDKLGISEHGHSVRRDSQYNEMQISLANVMTSLRNNAPRDDSNNLYKTFRGKLNVFYGGNFQTWPSDFQDAHNRLKAEPSLSQRYPGKFKVKAKKGQSSGSQGQSSGSQGQSSGSQGKSSGSQGKSSGSQGKSSGSQGKSSGSQGKSSGSQGKSSGSQGKSSGSQGKSSGSQGKSSGSQGQSSGSQDDSSGSQDKKQEKGFFRKLWCRFAGTTTKNKSGWGSGDAEDCVNDANDTLMNH